MSRCTTLASQKDFVQIMTNLPVEVSDEDIEEMFEFADKNKDGKLSYKEFKESTTYIEYNQIRSC